MSTILRHSISKLGRHGRAVTGTTVFRQNPKGILAQFENSNPPSMWASCRQFATSGNKEPDKKNKVEEEDESHLNWKDRKEAPKWMQRIAPGKGGKWPPNPQEAAILLSGLALFVWSWTA